ncbi:MAG: DUF3302 domain-containing protein [Halieaceae bacterium]|nr:DUF3302 domain-containing protein [Halieaceae bacterium]
MLEIFALIVLMVLVAAAIWVIVMVGNIPGNIARSEAHPQADAINTLAWVGLFTLGVAWFVALVWAKFKPLLPPATLEARVAELESKVAELEVGS